MFCSSFQITSSSWISYVDEKVAASFRIYDVIMSNQLKSLTFHIHNAVAYCESSTTYAPSNKTMSSNISMIRHNSPCGTTRVTSRNIENQIEYISKYSFDIEILVLAKFGLNISVESFILDWSGYNCSQSHLLISYKNVANKICGHVLPWTHITFSNFVKLSLNIINTNIFFSFYFRYTIFDIKHYETIDNLYNFNPILCNLNSSEIMLRNLVPMFSHEHIFTKTWSLRANVGDGILLNVGYVAGVLTLYEGSLKEFEIGKTHNHSRNSSFKCEYFTCLIHLQSFNSNTYVLVTYEIVHHVPLTIKDYKIKKHIEISNRNAHVYQQTLVFDVHYSNYGKLKFHVDEFSGYANRFCDFGGLYFERELPKVNKYMHRSVNYKLDPISEVVCEIEDNHLFLQSKKELVLSAGRTKFVFYSLSKSYFSIKFKILIHPSECEGIIDICLTCSYALKLKLLEVISLSSVSACTLIKSVDIQLINTCLIIQSSVWTKQIQYCSWSMQISRTKGYYNIHYEYFNLKSYTNNVCSHTDLEVHLRTSYSQKLKLLSSYRRLVFNKTSIFQARFTVLCPYSASVSIARIDKNKQSTFCPQIQHSRQSNESLDDSNCGIVHFKATKRITYLFAYRVSKYFFLQMYDLQLHRKGMCSSQDNAFILTESHNTHLMMTGNIYDMFIVQTKVNLTSNKSYLLHIATSMFLLILDKFSHSDCTIIMNFATKDYHIKRPEIRQEDFLTYNIEVS